jgi:hypothetical protein
MNFFPRSRRIAAVLSGAIAAANRNQRPAPKRTFTIVPRAELQRT